MYEDYTLIDPGEISDTDEPDVIVDVPIVKVDEIHFELDDLEARVALHAKVLDLVELNVGVMVTLGKVELNIKGVEAQALLRARLDHVTAIIDRVLTTLDRNPELLESIGKSLESVGEGAGEGVGQIGKGAGSAVEDVGEGAGGARQRRRQRRRQRGRGRRRRRRRGRQRRRQRRRRRGRGRRRRRRWRGRGRRRRRRTGGRRARRGGRAGGWRARPGRRTARRAGRSGRRRRWKRRRRRRRRQWPDGEQTCKSIVVKELGSAASEEAKELGLAATQKAVELSQRRRQKRAEKHNATEAALRQAQEAGIDLDEIDGSGADGRITVVRRARRRQGRGVGAMNTKANVEAIWGRIQGRSASRYRAAAIASTAGVGVATSPLPLIAQR